MITYELELLQLIKPSFSKRLISKVLIERE